MVIVLFSLNSFLAELSEVWSVDTEALKISLGIDANKQHKVMNKYMYHNFKKLRVKDQFFFLVPLQIFSNDFLFWRSCKRIWFLEESH